MQHSATLFNTLQKPKTLCNTLQHSATLCNTLQHTATANGSTALHYAAQYDKVDVVKYLLNLDDDQGFVILCESCRTCMRHVPRVNMNKYECTIWISRSINVKPSMSDDGFVGGFSCAIQCNTLEQTYVQRSATRRNALQHTATHCNTLQHTATHCNTLQYTATHCNTLQHTSTCCNML